MTLTRRSLLKHALLAGAWYGAVGRSFAQASSPEVLGQGDFKYRVVPGWGQEVRKTIPYVSSAAGTEAGRYDVSPLPAAKRVMSPSW